MKTEILSEHFFHLQTESRVTAEALADSLIGLDGVIRRSADILQVFLSDGARIKTEVLIKSIEVASYKENFFVRLVFGKGRTMEKNIEELRKTLRLDKMGAKTLVAIFVGVLIVYVAWKSLKPGDPASPHVEKSFDQYCSRLNVSRGELIAIVEGSVTNISDLKRNVTKLTHPAGDTKSGALILDHEQKISIPSEVIQVVPARYVADVADEPFNDIDNCQIVVRAVDLDRSNQGWAAIASEISDRRLPLRVGEDLDPAKIPVGHYIYADITVLFNVDRYGNKTPKCYLLKKWRETPTLSSEK